MSSLGRLLLKEKLPVGIGMVISILGYQFPRAVERYFTEPTLRYRHATCEPTSPGSRCQVTSLEQISHQHADFELSLLWQAGGEIHETDVVAFEPAQPVSTYWEPVGQSVRITFDRFQRGWYYEVVNYFTGEAPVVYLDASKSPIDLVRWHSSKALLMQYSSPALAVFAFGLLVAYLLAARGSDRADGPEGGDPQRRAGSPAPPRTEAPANPSSGEAAEKDDST